MIPSAASGISRRPNPPGTSSCSQRTAFSSMATTKPIGSAMARALAFQNSRAPLGSIVPTEAGAQALLESCGADLVLGPGVERIVDGEFELELALVVEPEQGKTVGDRRKATRLWRRIAIFRHVGPVDHLGE